MLLLLVLLCVLMMLLFYVDMHGDHVGDGCADGGVSDGGGRSTAGVDVDEGVYGGIGGGVAITWDEVMHDICVGVVGMCVCVFFFFF